METKDQTSEALNEFFDSPTIEEIDPVQQMKNSSINSKQFSLFSSSILMGYLQGAASPLFMEASLESYMDILLTEDNSKIKAFLCPLFSILHTNKNFKVRQVNPSLVPVGKEREFETIIKNFKNSSRLEGFLATYKTYLNFLISNGFNIEKEKNFTNLEELSIKIMAYREVCVPMIISAKKELITEVDIKDLDF